MDQPAGVACASARSTSAVSSTTSNWTPPTVCRGRRVHAQVLGAADDEVVEPVEGLCLADPLLARAFAGLRLGHPDPAAAGAAAERVGAVARHLDQLGAGCLDQLARRVGDVVVARQIARVVVGDARACERGAQGDRALRRQWTSSSV